MTALQWIVKEAKALKKKYPKRFKTWTEYVKQASAIYASKNKSKSAIGKRKPVAKKKTVKGSTHKDTRSHNVNVRVVSGTKLQKGELVLRNKRKTISENKVLREIEKVKKDILALEKLQKDHITKKHKSSIGAVIRKKHTNIKALLKDM
jgi:hypothetical protein